MLAHFFNLDLRQLDLFSIQDLNLLVRGPLGLHARLKVRGVARITFGIFHKKAWKVILTFLRLGPKESGALKITIFATSHISETLRRFTLIQGVSGLQTRSLFEQRLVVLALDFCSLKDQREPELRIRSRFLCQA